MGWLIYSLFSIVIVLSLFKHELNFYNLRIKTVEFIRKIVLTPFNVVKNNTATGFNLIYNFCFILKL